MADRVSVMAFTLVGDEKGGSESGEFLRWDGRSYCLQLRKRPACLLVIRRFQA